MKKGTHWTAIAKKRQAVSSSSNQSKKTKPEQKRNQIKASCVQHHCFLACSLCACACLPPLRPQRCACWVEGGDCAGGREEEDDEEEEEPEEVAVQLEADLCSARVTGPESTGRPAWCVAAVCVLSAPFPCWLRPFFCH